MNKLLPPARRRTAFLGFLAAALLLAGGSCKPAPPAATTQPSATPSTGVGQPNPAAASNAPRQPAAEDFQAFFQSLFPAAIKVTEVKTEPPVRMPNTSPADNVWLLKVKLVLTPTVDLLDLPPAADVQPLNDLVAELNGLVAWRNAYVRSPYARTYGPCEIKVPASVAPQLLVVTQSKDKPLLPIYGKVAAEWQVDHWQFENMDLDLPALGKTRSSFAGGPTVVQGSPEADAFLMAERKAIVDAKQRQAAIENSYAKELAAATRPGTTYQGQINHRLGIQPCILRFLEVPPGGDPRMTTFEVRLTNEPTYQFLYTAKLVTPLPCGAPAAASTNNDESFRLADNSDGKPMGNLTVNFSRGSGGGKDESGRTPPGMILRGQVGMYTAHNQSFLVLDHRIEGIVSQYTNGDFVLKAQEKQ